MFLPSVNHIEGFDKPYHVVVVWEMGLEVVRVSLVGVKWGMG